MSEQRLKEVHLALIREIEANAAVNQRILSQKAGISLGKTNYLLKELVKKGLVKARNFSSRSDKIKRINYILTQKGFQEKIRLMQHFMQRKELEYNRLKEEWEKLSR